MRAWPGGVTAPPADGYLALYHDQGLIPTKLIAFDDAVNTTLGLPFIRTSPDHGTAFSLAGQGLAREGSMVAALLAAAELKPLQQTPARGNRPLHRGLMRIKGWSNSTGAPFSTRTSATSPEISASISFISFSGFQDAKGLPHLNPVAHLHERGLLWRRRTIKGAHHGGTHLNHV